MRAVDVITKKRDGHVLSREELRFFVDGVTTGSLPDYQASALLMAVLLRGMTSGETAALTDAMVDSGIRVDLTGIPGVKVDKHSTGGVGDKTSLIVAPLAVACGLLVPMMSGRGLGHTGGTLDKLESIPGFRVNLSLDEMRQALAKTGCAMIGQTAEIAPADKKLYALRDVTGTVESIPLIAASIMSKKLAEGLQGLVLDTTRGSGAFLPDLEDSLLLAQTMIQLGEDHGCRTVALLTAMDRPLGEACGNALETAEAIASLRGEGPDDLWQVTLALGVEMLVIAGVAPDPAAARQMLEAARSSGKAAEVFRAVIAAQRGDARVIDDPSLLPVAPIVEEYAAKRAGTVSRIEPRTVGRAIVAMGGGRQTVDDAVDPAVGFVFRAKPGDRVAAGQSLAAIHARDQNGLEIARAALDSSVTIAARAKPPLPLISHRVTIKGVEVLA
jgi:pyrimidine-nucleoside phosphorylase